MQVALETPFIGETARVEMPEGMSVYDMCIQLFKSTENVSAWLPGKGVAFDLLDPTYWKRIYPKKGSGFRFLICPSGGGSDGGKNVLAVVAAIAVAVVAPALAGAILPGLAGAAAGTAGAIAFQAVTAGITAAGLYGISLLFPPSTPGVLGTTQDASAKHSYENISTGSNVLQAGSPIPSVRGLRRVFPPLLARPHSFLDEEGIPNLNLIYGLAGKHATSEHKIGESLITDMEGITLQERDGALGTPVTTFIDKITYTESIERTFKQFSHGTSLSLEDQSTFINSEPRWERVTTRAGDFLEEFYIRLTFNGLVKTNDPVEPVFQPFRIRIRPTNTGTWYNLPEVHWFGITSAGFMKEVRFRWSDGNDFGTIIPAEVIQARFFAYVPAIDASLTLTDGTVNGDGNQWDAHSTFKDGSGISDTANIASSRRGLQVTLDASTFPKGSYDVEVIVGGQSASENFVASTYAHSSIVDSFFFGRKTTGDYKVFTNQAFFSVGSTLNFATSIFDIPPIGREGINVMAVNAVHVNVPDFSVLAGAYVDNYNSATGLWDTNEVTRNPAAHLRDISISDLNAGRVNASLLENTEFVDWWTECDTQNYKLNAVLAGQTLQDAKTTITSAGLGRARKADTYGVMWHKDRSSDVPVQTFSHLTCSNISWKKVYGKIPGGITAKFVNEDKGFADDQINVRNPLLNHFAEYVEMEYDSITDEPNIRIRALFDLLQLTLNNVIWSMDARIEHIRAKRGDLIGVTVDFISNKVGASYIRQMSNSTTITIIQDLDSVATTGMFSLAAIFAEDGLFNSGTEFGVSVHTSSGVETRKIVHAEGNQIHIDAAFTGSAIDLAGAHINIGPYTEVVKKCIVTDIRPKPHEKASLTMLEWTPEIEERLRNGS